MAPCPSTLPDKVEDLGRVTLQRFAPPVPPNVRGIFDPRGVLPPGAAKSITSTVQPGSWPVLRTTKYVFDAEVTDCVSVLEYTFCQYTQCYEISVAGEIVFSKTSDVKVRDDGELSGVCIEEVIGLLFSLGTKAIPNPLELLGSAGNISDERRGQAALLAQLTPAPTSARAGLAAPTLISAAAVQRIVDLAATEGQETARATDLPSLVTGSGDIADVIDDLSAIDTESTRTAVVALQRAGQPLRLAEGVVPDDAFIAVAARTLAELRSSDPLRPADRPSRSRPRPR